jgi:hypothetical protein
MKHTMMVLLVGLAIQASSAAAVRAESSGRSGAPAPVRSIDADSDTDTDVVSSPVSTEDEARASSTDAATSSAQPITEIHNNNNIQVETTSAAQNATAADTTAQAAAQADAQQNQKQKQKQANPDTQLAYNNDHHDGELEMAEHHEHETPSVAIIPMIGTSAFSGRWSINTSNDYNFGLGLEFPVTRLFSIEGEGSYGSYQLAYTNTVAPGPGFRHHFDQYLMGANAKLYFWQAMLRPYVGAGLDAIYYANMNRGPYDPNPFSRLQSYNQMIGAGQLLAGLDCAFSQSISIGVRGSWLVPFINTPPTGDTVGVAGPGAAPGYEEANLINASFYRVQGTVRVAF